MSLPKHLAIIMDGNGRWASARGRPRTFGHIKGSRVAKKIITACSRRGLSHLTLYAFSAENWTRPEAEVSFLMLLLRRYLKRETENLVRENIRFDVIGDLAKVPEDIVHAIEYARTKTAVCTGLHLNFAIGYGSRQEILQAVRNISEKIISGELNTNHLTEKILSQEMQTYPTPDPDFIIRTSGEQRLSNFLLWQAAYSEFYFCDTLWPDFTESDLDLAFAQYLKRERRFGAVSISENAHH